MLRLDNRTGSKELERYFPAYGLTPKLCRLEFGDLDFTGEGPGGKCAVVVERKRIDDLVASIHSKRLSGHQLPGMAAAYDYGYLLVEGIWRPGPDGELQVSYGNGRWVSRSVHTRAINNYVFGLALRAGLLPWRTMGPEDTVSFVVDQFRMWQKPWGEHQAHEAVYAPAEQGNGRAGFAISFRPRKVTQCERYAMQTPGLDWKARFVAQYFKSGKRMFAAGLEEWRKVKWRTKDGKKEMRISKQEAEKILVAMESED